MGSRRDARESAVQILFQLDFNPGELGLALQDTPETEELLGHFVCVVLALGPLQQRQSCHVLNGLHEVLCRRPAL